MFQTVARNFSILTATQVAGAAIIFLWIAFAARQLGPAQFGTYILITTYVRLFSMIINSGVAPISFRELARHRNNALELFSDILSMRLALGIAGYVALVAVLFLLGEDRELLALLAIAGIQLLLDPFNETYTAYYTAIERVGLPSAFGIASAILFAVVGIAVLLAGYGLAALITADVVTNIVGTLFWTFAFRAMIFRFTIRVRPAAWRRLLMLIVPFAPIHLCNQLNRVLNVILLGRLSGPIAMDQSVGYYGPAQTITNSAVMLVMSLRRVLIPPVTAKLSQGYTVTHDLDLALKLVIAVFALPLLLATSFMSPELISLLYGEKYAPSAMVLVLLGWAGALQIVALVPETFLFAHPSHRMQDYIVGAFVSVLINITVCVLLIKDYGVVGAAAGAVASRVVYLVYVANYCGGRLGKQALKLRKFADTAILLLSAYGVWYLSFVVITNAWIACALAIVLTLPLMAAFILYLRSRSATRPET